MKSVCIVVYRLAVGGAEQVVVEEIREFLRRGFTVRLITLCPERTHSLMPRVPESCKKDVIEFHSLFDWRALVTLARLFRETKPDIIITQMWFANTVGRIAARWAGAHTRVLAFEQNVYDKLELKSRKQFLVDRYLQGWCRRVAAASEAIKESLVRCGIEGRRVVVIHDAIDIARMTNATPSPIRAELGIIGAFVYLFVGRLVHQKGVDVLLNAFAQQESGVLLIAGDGEERVQLERQVDALGIAPRVFFLGVRHDIPSLMKAADCFVLASRLEGLGIVLIEAMACGIPVIATSVDGIPEAVEHGKSGILVPSEDPVALAVALRQISGDSNMRKSMGEKGVERAARLFSIETHVTGILACFEKAR